MFLFHPHGEDISGINKLIFQIRKAQFGEVLMAMWDHMDGKLKSTFIYFLTWVCLIPKPQYHHLSKWACGHTCSRIHGESLKVKISEFHP